MRSTILPLLALSACGQGLSEADLQSAADLCATQVLASPELTALREDLDTLRAEVATLQAPQQDLAALDARVSALDEALSARVGALEAQAATTGTEVGALLDEVVGAPALRGADRGFDEQFEGTRIDEEDACGACVTPDALTPLLAGLATDDEVAAGDAAVQAWVEGQGFATEAWCEAADAGVRAWVDGQGYATSDALAASDAATRVWVAGQGYAHLSDITAADGALLDRLAANDDALRAWVDAQDFATASDVSAVSDWVIGQGYATIADVQAGDAAERAWVIDQGFASTSDVSDVSTWVINQGFATTDALAAGDLAVQAWVTDQGFATDAALAGAIATCATVADLDDAIADTEAWVVSQGYAPASGQDVLTSDLQVLTSLVSGLRFAELVVDDRVIRVPTDEPDVQAALDAVASWTFAGGSATILVEPAGCGATYTSAIEVDHPQGASLHIASESGDPTLCVLRFEGTANGVRVAPGRALGSLSGFTLLAASPVDGSGVSVEAGAALFDGPALISRGWPWAGFHVKHGGYADVHGAVAEDNTQAGFFVDHGGMLAANRSVARNNNGVGYQAVFAGSLDADASMAIGNRWVGYESRDNSHVQAAQAISCGNGDGGERAGGFAASAGGTLYANQARATGNQGSGFSAYMGASISAIDATAGVADPADPACAAGNDRFGFFASEGSSLNAAGSTSYGAGNHGYLVRHGSFGELTHATATQGGESGFVIGVNGAAWADFLESSDNAGDGVLAYLGGSMWGVYGTVVGNNGAGFAFGRGSTANVSNATVVDNGTYGVAAMDRAFVEASYSTVQGNDGAGLQSGDGGYLRAVGAAVSGNSPDNNIPLNALDPWGGRISR